MAQLTLKTGTTQALLSEPVVDGALLAPTDKKSVYLDQGNSRKEIKTGHTIQNSSDVNIADRDTLQFIGNVSVSDDSTNNKTIINVGSGVQPDWAQTNTDAPDYIKNKPTNLVSDANYVHTDNNYDASAKAAVDALGTASTKNVPASGDAASTEVVMGNDSRLTDARNAADVSDWAKASTKPSYAYSEITNTPTLGTAAAKDYTTSVTNTGADSTKLVESGAVRAAIDAEVSSVYHPSGSKTVAELTSALLIASNSGNVYNMTTSGTASSDFVTEEIGKHINIGDNVAIVNVGTDVSPVYKFDLLSGFVDLTNYVQKSSTSGLLKNDGTVDTTITGAVSANTSAISGIKNGTSIDSFADVETALADKVDKVTGKGLSANDYTDEDKDIVDGVTDALAEKVDKDITEVLDEGVYLFRKAPADKYTCDECVVGGSVAWNQLIHELNSSNYLEQNVTDISYGDNSCSFTATARFGQIYERDTTPIIAGHKYLTSVIAKSNSNNYEINVNRIGYITINTTFNTYSIISSATQNTNGKILIFDGNESNWSQITIKDIITVDLTLALGTTIADYIYNLEQATAGAGVAKLREWGFPIDKYTPYNTGELVSVKTSGKKVVGKNLCPSFPAGSYSLSGLTYTVRADGTIFFDANKTATADFALNLFDTTDLPDGTYTISGCPSEGSESSYKLNWSYHGANDYGLGATALHTAGSSGIFRIQIANGFSTSANGLLFKPMIRDTSISDATYEPYTETIHALSPIELRGVPKLVEGNLVYDGDTYESNGNVSRKYGIVDLGSLTWSYDSNHSRLITNDISSLNPANTNSSNPNAICAKYDVRVSDDNGSIFISSASGYKRVYVYDSAYTDASTFKAAMSGVMLVYKLATPTTETADTYANTIAVDPNGTEEWIDDRIVPVPVGHKSKYGDNKFVGDILGMANVQERVDELVNDTDVILNVYGSKNLLPNNAVSQVMNGVTFTVNADGSVTANGTATGNAVCILCTAANFGDTLMSTYTGYLRTANGYTISSGINDDTVGGATYEPNASRVYVFVASGRTVSNLTFKPMIRDARIKDDTYVPYAMTNRELTESIKIRKMEFTNAQTTADGRLILNGMGYNIRIITSRLIDSDNKLMIPIGNVLSSYGNPWFFLLDNATGSLITTQKTFSGTLYYQTILI